MYRLTSSDAKYYTYNCPITDTNTVDPGFSCKMHALLAAINTKPVTVDHYLVLLHKHSRKETRTKPSALSDVFEKHVDARLIFTVSHQVRDKAASQTASTLPWH